MNYHNVKNLYKNNICFFTSSKGWGGLERNMLVLARWMSDAGHHVEVVVPEGSETWLHGIHEKLNMNAIPSFSRHLNRGAANRWARGRSHDILWVRDRADLAFAGHASKAMGAALIMQQAMQIPQAKNAPWHVKRYRRVDAWVCGLEHLRRECLERTPLAADQCHVLPLPLDECWFTAPRTERHQAQISLGLELPKGTWLMGTVGRLDPGKGQQTALRALASLPEHVHWLFVGNNTVNNGVDERTALATLANELGLAERVHFLAAREDVLPVYDALDAFGMTSHAETIGTVTLEAMARKVSVVGTDAGGTSELLAEGRGLLCPPRNPKALAAAVLSLMNEDAVARKTRTDRGRAYAERCRPGQLIPAWEDLIQSVVESRRKA